MRQAASAQTEIPAISPQPPRSGVAGLAGRAKKTGAHARAKVLVTATERESTRGGGEVIELECAPSDRAGYTVIPTSNSMTGRSGAPAVASELIKTARPPGRRPPSPRRDRTRRQPKKTGDERPC